MLVFSQTDSLQGKELGLRFKALDAEAKKKYEDVAAKDKIRYQKEMAAYKAKQKAEAEAEKEDSDDDGVDDSDNGADDSDSGSDSD